MICAMEVVELTCIPFYRTTATGMVKTARWLIDSDVGGSLVKMKDTNGDTAAHDAADNG